MQDAVDKRKPWHAGIGAAIGLLVGGLLWWSAYEPGLGLLQKPQLLVGSAALGMFIVIARNKRKKVGQFDEDHQAKNRRGRL